MEVFWITPRIVFVPEFPPAMVSVLEVVTDGLMVLKVPAVKIIGPKPSLSMRPPPAPILTSRLVTAVPEPT